MLICFQDVFLLFSSSSCASWAGVKVSGVGAAPAAGGGAGGGGGGGAAGGTAGGSVGLGGGFVGFCVVINC